MKRRAKREHEHVHLNFKVAVIAAFFFLLVLEIHSPVFKHSTTGQAITSLGHNTGEFDKIDISQICPCPPGKETVKETCISNCINYQGEEYICWDRFLNVVEHKKCLDA